MDVLMPRAVILLNEVVILQAFTLQHRLAALAVWRYKTLHNQHDAVTSLCRRLINTAHTAVSRHHIKSMSHQWHTAAHSVRKSYSISDFHMYVCILRAVVQPTLDPYAAAFL